jgi:aminodeoxyfutalosine deaminase
MSEESAPVISWKARVILCPDQGPLTGHRLITRGPEIVGLFPDRSLPHIDREIDLDDSVLLPMPINAHCHLDLSSFDSPIPAGGHFTDWLTRVVMHRRSIGLSATDAVSRGIEQLCQYGTRVVGDIQASLGIASDLWSEHLSGTVYHEIVGLKPERYEPLWEWAHASLADSSARIRHGLSPHGPYSTSRVIFSRSAGSAPLATHWLESADEREFLATGRGPFRDFLERIDAWPQAYRPITNPWQELLTGGRWTLVHANYLSNDDENELAQRDVRDRIAAIVYCPRTHAHFGHLLHPAARLIEMGIPVALGTDSLASNPDLDVWNEAIWLSQHSRLLSPRQIVTMATKYGGSAIGDSRYGSFSPGSFAHLWGFRLRDGVGNDLWEATLDQASSRSAVIYFGELIDVAKR